jgi:CheY-like chemotaxis protein
MALTATDIESQIRTLKTRYRSQLGKRLDELDTLLWKIQASPHKEALAVELTRRVHSFVGSSGTYGYLTLSEKARALEDLLQSELTKSGPHVPPLEKIRSHIIALKSLSQRYIGDNPLDAQSQPAHFLAQTHQDIAPQPLHILLASDDPDIRELLALALSADGHTVTAVEDGLSATEAFLRHAPGLVILDLLMPGMDGCQTIRRIRQHEAPDMTPAIFLTSSQDETSIVRCLEAGGDDVLAKPVGWAVLRAKIAALQRRCAHSAAFNETPASAADA